MTQETRNAPIEIIRNGPIKASIWSNEGENGKYLTVTFARTYSKNGSPQDSNTFSGRDMLVLAEIARQAYCFVSNYKFMQTEFNQP